MTNNVLIQKANSLHKNVSSMLSGQFSPSYSPKKIENVNDVIDIANSSKKALAILFVVCFFFTLYALKKIKPSFVLKKNRFFEYKQEEVDKYNLVYYSVLIGFVIFVIASIVIYKTDSVRSFVFSDNCNMCI